MGPDGRQSPASQESQIFSSHVEQPSAEVLTLRGAMGAWNLRELRESFARPTTSGPPLIVDLHALTYGDEYFLGLLLDAYARGRLLLVGPLAPSFQHRLEETGTYSLFTICPTLEDALSNL